MSVSARPSPPTQMSVPGMEFTCAGAARNSALCSVKGARCTRPVGPRVPPPATTTVLSLGGTARPLPVWKDVSALRGLCCTVESAWSRLPAPVSWGTASSHQGLCCRRTVGTAPARKVSGSVGMMVPTARRWCLAVRTERPRARRAGTVCPRGGFVTTRMTVATAQMRKAVPPQAARRDRCLVALATACPWPCAAMGRTTVKTGRMSRAAPAPRARWPVLMGTALPPPCSVMGTPIVQMLPMRSPVWGK